ncbi:MAG TPA: zinc ribbon domain-containing protein [Gemmatimonadaceae bacterium]|nr:zinc ribbon domain-containing protein [Gemmatimonadaceae bacterium]
MPTYEYRCPEGHEFERFFRKISDAATEVACPECGKIAERRMSAGAGLVFKGSGFYLTDYGKNAHRKGGDAQPSSKSDSSGGDSASESKSDSKSEGKSESKGEAKSESKSAESKSSDAKPADKPAPKNSKAGE